MANQKMESDFYFTLPLCLNMVIIKRRKLKKIILKTASKIGLIKKFKKEL